MLNESDSMQSNWHCLDCLVNRHLDKHGRCDVCGSESVIDLSLSAFNPNNSTPMPRTTFARDKMPVQFSSICSADF